MKRKREHLIRDAFFIFLSVGIAYYIIDSKIVHTIAASFGDLDNLGIFFAGMFFTSAFTTAPAIAVLAELAETNSLISVVFWGALGAVAGDYLIFRLVKDRVADDIRYMLKQSKFRRLPHIFRTKLFHSLTPLVGALIIASPLPDELGLTLLGLSKINDRSFFLLSFVMNALGILIIALVGGSS